MRSLLRYNPTMQRRATREWSKSTGRSSGLKGARRSSRWKRVMAFGGLLLVVFLIGRSFGKDAEPTAVEDELPILDVGGEATYQPGTVEDILSGTTVTVPLNDPIVLDESAAAEADIAQDTTQVTVDGAALETVLLGIGDFHGSGTASSQFVDGKFQHVIVASLPSPPEGYAYEGWLIRSKPFDFFSTGRLIQHADDLKWYLLLELAEDRRDYKKVVVTLEPSDANPAPADHVLEGVFE